MALQQCRTSLLRSRRAVGGRLPCRRSLTVAQLKEQTPQSFKVNAESERPAVPRWKETPVGMKALIPMDFAKKEHNKIWTVNNDPERLDAVYDKFLGPGGSKLLPEELKWLAITHKSFDQGRRGFNNRLALVGRSALQVEAMKEVLSHPRDPKSQQEEKGFDRKPFEHPQLSPLDNFDSFNPRTLIDKQKLYLLAMSVGLPPVVRWKPRLPGRLNASGISTVMASTIMAISGALTLQLGTNVASKIMRERILARVAKL